MKAFGLFIFSIIALTCSCDKSPTGPGDGDPPRTFLINFMLVDSAGNNLLPYDLRDNPIVDPYSFHASSDWNDDIGRYLHHQEHGFIFQMSQEYYDFMYDPAFQQDSTFRMYPCFGSRCDTFTVSHPIDGSCQAKAIYWGSDTTFNYQCYHLQVQYDE